VGQTFLPARRGESATIACGGPFRRGESQTRPDRVLSVTMVRGQV